MKKIFFVPRFSTISRFERPKREKHGDFTKNAISRLIIKLFTSFSEGR